MVFKKKKQDVFIDLDIINLYILSKVIDSFPSGSEVKNQPEMQEMQVCFLGQQDPLEEGMTEDRAHIHTSNGEYRGRSVCVGHAATRRSLGKAEQKVRWSQTVYGLY